MTDDRTNKSRFVIADMDCPSEEQMIRTALSDAERIVRLDFDIPRRGLTVWHAGDAAPILARLEGLNLGAVLVATEDAPHDEAGAGTEADHSRVLRWVLGINATMFAVELVAGWLAESTGLLADSLDMLADAGVYGIALWAVGRAQSFQLTAARVSGWLQLALAIGVLAEVARRAVMGSAPEPPMIMGTAAVALAANVACMWALSRHRSAGAHMQASWIFTTNDVIANIGVILAGALVSWTSSAIPDLVIGALIGLIVLRARCGSCSWAAPADSRTASASLDVDRVFDGLGGALRGRGRRVAARRRPLATRASRWPLRVSRRRRGSSRA
jgi:Co/Zn/Cd efflux system component